MAFLPVKAGATTFAHLCWILSPQTHETKFTLSKHSSHSILNVTLPRLCRSILISQPIGGTDRWKQSYRSRIQQLASMRSKLSSFDMSNSSAYTTCRACFISQPRPITYFRTGDLNPATRLVWSNASDRYFTPSGVIAN